MSADFVARALAGSQGRSANTQALIRALRSQALFPAPTWRCPPANLASVTVPAAGAVSAINGLASTSANVPLTNTAKLTWLGGTADKDINVTYFARGGWYAGGRTNQYSSYEFMHTGTQFEVQMLCGGGLSAGTNFRVLVNDCIAGTGAVPADGGNRLIRVQFSGSATRRIRIETAGGQHRGINVAAPSEIGPTGRSYPLVTLIGDSFAEGTGAAQYYDGEALSALRAIGCNPALAGVGATGILNPGTGGKVNWQDPNRLADLALNGWTDQITGAAPNPAMAVIMMSINDTGQPSTTWNGSANYQDAVTKGLYALIDHWQAQRPGKPLVVFGPTWINENPILDIFRIRDAGQEACAASPNVWFIDRLQPGAVLRKGSALVTQSTGTTAAGSKIVTAIGSTANIAAGSALIANGIPSGARVVSVDSATQVTLDSSATSAGTGVALNFRNDAAALYTTTSDTTHPGPAGHNLDGLWMARQLRELILTQFA